MAHMLAIVLFVSAEISLPDFHMSGLFCFNGSYSHKQYFSLPNSLYILLNVYEFGQLTWYMRYFIYVSSEENQKITRNQLMDEGKYMNIFRENTITIII